MRTSLMRLPKLDALLLKKTYDRATEAALGCLRLAFHEEHYRLQRARFEDQKKARTRGHARERRPGQQRYLDSHALSMLLARSRCHTHARTTRIFSCTDRVGHACMHMFKHIYVYVRTSAHACTHSLANTPLSSLPTPRPHSHLTMLLPTHSRTDLFVDELLKASVP